MAINISKLPASVKCFIFGIQSIKECSEAPCSFLHRTNGEEIQAHRGIDVSCFHQTGTCVAHTKQLIPTCLSQEGRFSKHSLLVLCPKVRESQGERILFCSAVVEWLMEPKDSRRNLATSSLDERDRHLSVSMPFQLDGNCS